MATVLTQHQKFRKAKTTIEQLPTLAYEVGMVEFIERMNVLEHANKEYMGKKRNSNCQRAVNI